MNTRKQHDGNRRRLRDQYVALLVATLTVFVVSSPGRAHEASIPLAGKKVVLQGPNGSADARFLFKNRPTIAFAPGNPALHGFAFHVIGNGDHSGHTGLIELDPELWNALGKPAGRRGYIYKDGSGSRGGVKKVIFRPGKIKVLARGANWPWNPAGEQLRISVFVTVGEPGGDEFEQYCTVFDSDSIVESASSFLRAKKSAAPSSCITEVCGNGRLELGEECDDGNLSEDDGCNNDCSHGDCVGETFSSTMEAIQATIFDNPVYQCSNALCHGNVDDPAGELDLRAGQSHANLVDVLSAGSGAQLDRVEPGNRAASFLYEKLEAGTFGFAPNGGAAMPIGDVPLSEDHLEAIRLWIQGGAPGDGVVAGTADLLSGCLPDATPLVLPPPDPPAPGTGAQLQSTPWPLPKQFENEICFATYYDLNGTGLIPSDAIVPCPTVCSDDRLTPCSSDADCVAGECEDGPAINSSGLCFRYHSQTVFQDPQSHHSFIRAYLGQFGVDDEGWGAWTYKTADPKDPINGTACDPTDVDPTLGYNPGCSSEVQEAVACLGAGPDDLSTGSSSGLSGSATAPAFAGSGVPVFEQRFADGVFAVLPMQGMIVWNSHAFNLTEFDSTMSSYVNIEAATPEHQTYPLKPINDSVALFVQNVPPFETREYCRTWTAPENARIFLLTSHTHIWGVRWRTWGPPNEPCSAPRQESCGEPRSDAPLYISTEYSDPLNLYFDPPLPLTSSDRVDRTFLYCSLYDNGSTPTSPPVKRQSTSVVPPLIFGQEIPVGGPCPDTTVACFNGPNRGMLCGGDHSVCDSAPGFADGICDACPVLGGATTTDEMMLLQGGYFVQAP